MSEKNKDKLSGFGRFISGKGFYIVLLLCVAVIGAAAWAMLFYPEKAKNDVPEGLTVYSGSSEDGIEAVSPALFVPFEENTAEETGTAFSETETAEAETLQPVEDEPTAVFSEEPPEPVSIFLPEIKAPDCYVWPVSGNIALPYSVNELVYNRTMADWRTHAGIDIEANIGAKVMAIAPGTVSEIYEDEMYGTTVVISHGSGIESVYSNLAATPAVGVGGSVALGDVIGAVGDTALCESADVTHLHFAMRSDGEIADPLEYLPTR